MQRHVRQSKNFSCYFQLYSIRCCCSLRYSRNTVGENKRKTKKEKQSPELFKQLLLLRAMILEAPIVSEEIPSVLAQANSIRVVSCLPGWLLQLRVYWMVFGCLNQPENWVPFICKSGRQENEIVVSSVQHLVPGRIRNFPPPPPVNTR